MQNNLNLHRTLLGIAAVIIILAGVKLAAEIVVPFLLSLFIAIICSPIIKAMTQRHVPHWLAITLLFVLISLVFFFLVGLINSTAREFTQSIPQYKILLSQRINDLTALSQRFNLPFTLSRETIQENFDPSIIMNFVSRVLLNFSGVVSNVFVLVLVVIFMLAEAPTMKHKFAMVISSTPHDAAKEERHIDRVLQGVIGYLGIKSITMLTDWCWGIYFVGSLWGSICHFVGNLEFLVELCSEYWFYHCGYSDYCASLITKWFWCWLWRGSRCYCDQYGCR